MSQDRRQLKVCFERQLNKVVGHGNFQQPSEMIKNYTTKLDLRRPQIVEDMTEKLPIGTTNNFIEVRLTIKMSHIY